jgi:hypothetical protein
MAGHTRLNAVSSCVRMVVPDLIVAFGASHGLATGKKTLEQGVLSAVEGPPDAQRYELWCHAQKAAALLSPKSRGVFIDRFGRDEIEYQL